MLCLAEVSQPLGRAFREAQRQRGKRAEEAAGVPEGEAGKQPARRRVAREESYLCGRDLSWRLIIPPGLRGPSEAAHARPPGGLGRQTGLGGGITRHAAPEGAPGDGCEERSRSPLLQGHGRSLSSNLKVRQRPSAVSAFRRDARSCLRISFPYGCPSACCVLGSEGLGPNVIDMMLEISWWWGEGGITSG